MKAIGAYDDKAVLDEIGAGKTDAYEKIVRRYTVPLLAYARRMLGALRACEAEDVVQETFIDAYFSLSSLKNPDAFSAWLYGILKNKCRRRLCAPLPPESLEEHLSGNGVDEEDGNTLLSLLADPEDSPEELLLRAEQANAVSAAFSRLPPALRQTGRDYFLTGLPIRQIAELRGLPIGTVKRRIFDAREKLKKELTDMSELFDRNENTKENKTEIEALVRAVTEKIEQVEKYFDGHRSTDGYADAYRAARAMTEQLPEKEGDPLRVRLSGAAASRFYEYRDEAIRDAVKAEDAKALWQLFIDNWMSMQSGGCPNVKDRIHFWETEALPTVLSLPHTPERDAAESQFYFWYAYDELEIGDREKAAELCALAEEKMPRDDLLYAMVLSGKKATEKLLKEGRPDGKYAMIATAETWDRKKEGIFFRTQPGFTNKRAVYFPFGGNMLTLAANVDSSIPLPVCDEATKHPMISVVSDSEHVSVPAGEFDNCRHVHRAQDEDGDTAELWFARGAGLVRAEFEQRTKETSVFELQSYEIRGGEGYFPVAVGNLWKYDGGDRQDFAYLHEGEITQCDDSAFTISWAALKYEATDSPIADLTSEDCVTAADQICESDPEGKRMDEAIGQLKKAVRLNTDDRSVALALEGIAYLSRMKTALCEKHWRLCPGSVYGNVMYSVGGAIHDRFIGSFGPYRWGSRHEENKIFGMKPYRYLEQVCGADWDERWVPGFSEDRVLWDDAKAHIEVTGDVTVETPAGKFTGCRKLTAVAESKAMTPDGYFYDFSFVHCGKKEWYFAPGVGLVRFDCTWGGNLSSVCALTSYETVAAEDEEEYFPLHIGMSWVYDEQTIEEPYTARFTRKIVSGGADRFVSVGEQEFLFRGTDEEYEQFKRELYRNN